MDLELIFYNVIYNILINYFVKLLIKKLGENLEIIETLF
jgi:hypothetical protein